MNDYDYYRYLFYYFMKLKVTGHPSTRLIFFTRKMFLLDYRITVIEYLKITNYMRKVVPVLGRGNEGRGYIVKVTMLNGWSVPQKKAVDDAKRERPRGDPTSSIRGNDGAARRWLRARFICVGQDCVDNGT